MTVAMSSAPHKSAVPEDSVRFGTSGLRGRCEEFTPQICQAYVGAFVSLTRTDACGLKVYVAADRRKSSPQIALHVAQAVAMTGLEPVYLGILPTPALAAYAFGQQCLSIMITGSHIPAEYNGLKFYRHDGELTKEDEPELLARLGHQVSSPVRAISLQNNQGKAAELAYIDRYTTAFPAGLLEGWKLGVDLHSGAGTPLIASVLEELGASVHRFGQSVEFLPVDTEALDSERLEQQREVLRTYGLDGIVSADGDGDRPLLLDETGEQVSGDILGLLTGRYLLIDHLVTPVTSTSAIEATGWFQSVTRTKVGSPFVIAGMKKERGRIAGFEANGGFLLGTDLERGGRVLPKLLTRDAILPLIATLALASSTKKSLSDLVVSLPNRYKLSDRLTDIPPFQALSLLSNLTKFPAVRRSLAECLVDPVEIDVIDGVRLVCQNGSIVHFRRSGNAPEFRCYVETSDRQETRALLQSLMEALSEYFGKGPVPERPKEIAQ